MWVDMKATGVDLLVSAPQKGWTGSPGCAFVMLSERARKAIDASALPYLLKPYGLDEVHEAIHRVLGPPPSVQP